jgi:hypothetical protein
MNQSGGLKIATIIVMAMLGFSTLAVGMQLSSSGSEAATQNQTTAKSEAQGYNQTSSTSDPSCVISGGFTDLTVRNSAFLNGILP